MSLLHSHPHGEVLVLYAARRGYNGNLRRLIDAGADIEVRDSDGNQRSSVVVQRGFCQGSTVQRTKDALHYC